MSTRASAEVAAHTAFGGLIMRKALFASISVLSLSLASCMYEGGETASASTAVAAADTSAAIAAAVAAPDRPEAAPGLDEIRKPVETLAFLGLTPGMDAADMFPGQGYWAEIMAHVVGPDGSVVGLQPHQFGTGEAAVKAWAELEARAPGTSMARINFGAFDYPANSFDFMIFNLNYHDVYWESERWKIPYTDPAELVRSMYHAMRLGGIVGIIDHVGGEGDTREIVNKTHRISPKVVIADFEKEGFELVGQSDILANPDDDHTISAVDPAIRGKTDRFILKFRKPE